MSNPVRIELVPRTVDADDQTREDRTDAAERLVNLGLLDSTNNGRPGDTVTAGWTARINGVDVPAVTFSLEPVQAGLPVLVSLLIPADSVQVGDPSTGTTPPQARPAVEEKPTVHVWGSSGKPDPRESIPGWKPEPTPTAWASGTAAPFGGPPASAQAAADGHDHTLKRWTCGCDPVLLGIQDAAAKTGNIDLRVIQA
ncbi:hypothetical protein ACQP2Y_21525 [Actinoplanes sp. CA-051413]|uniref:hypothetical protein n=1 Tax=Actinoplanes sp. CA-051413 TaxID=3239899 RepID=UPI003D9844DE